MNYKKLGKLLARRDLLRFKLQFAVSKYGHTVETFEKELAETYTAIEMCKAQIAKYKEDEN